MFLDILVASLCMELKCLIIYFIFRVFSIILVFVYALYYCHCIILHYRLNHLKRIHAKLYQLYVVVYFHYLIKVDIEEYDILVSFLFTEYHAENESPFVLCLVYGW